MFKLPVLQLSIPVIVMTVNVAKARPAPLHSDAVAKGDPCEAAKPFAEKATYFSKTAVFRAALLAIQKKAGVAPAREHTTSFGKDTLGNAIASPVINGERSSSSIPDVSNGFADLHNHPNNTPPSSGDLYGLIRKNRKNRSYDIRYVITRAGTLYAFVIIDSAKASAFLAKYPPQQEPGYSPLFPDALLNEYREIQYKYNATEEITMAYLLEKYEAGVALLKQGAGGAFAMLRTSVSMVGDELVFTANDCK
ncbi:MAG TPA: hypothetical protein VER36_07485 [Flavisolibacter sp.]|nr:hypothetical protein [Flavisolibacter sp.]